MNENIEAIVLNEMEARQEVESVLESKESLKEKNLREYEEVLGY